MRRARCARRIRACAWRRCRPRRRRRRPPPAAAPPARVRRPVPWRTGAARAARRGSRRPCAGAIAAAPGRPVAPRRAPRRRWRRDRRRSTRGTTGAPALVVLAQRNVERGSGGPLDVPVARVGGDADDLVMSVRRRTRDVAEWVRAGQVAIGKGAIDHGHRRRILAIGVDEAAPSLQRDAERAEERGRHQLEVGGGTDAGRGRRVVDAHAAVRRRRRAAPRARRLPRVRPAWRRAPRAPRRRICHLARASTRPSVPGRRAQVAAGREVEVDGDAAGRHVAERHVLRGGHARQQPRGADQQQLRGGQLADHEHALPAARAAAAGDAGALQAASRRDADELQGRAETEHRRRAPASAARRTPSTPASRRTSASRGTEAGASTDERVEAPARQQQAEHAARHRHHQRLGEQLPHQRGRAPRRARHAWRSRPAVRPPGRAAGGRRWRRR